ncbi:WXG100 family type VII secretion target [Gordonia sp. X0973]|uniref:WXG100 family type VII secretion target n=1 Tax=Gordonia sp. X0973 TaxID=2742602 RepID=UPI000F542EC9|nr:WXG100 family type VII secretion target [Gordonia sp. X0973]QKT06524.1 WXG100 family type VII secretion target [Gordonia sp. X0973]
MTNEELRVDPDDLFGYARRLQGHVEEARGQFSSHHAKMESASETWGPASRAAMGNTVSAWREATKAIAGNIDDHAYAMRDAGGRYLARDQQNSAGIVAAADKTARLNLDT